MTRSTLLAAAALLLTIAAAHEASAQMGPGSMTPQYQRHLDAISSPAGWLAPGRPSPYTTPGYNPHITTPNYPTPGYHTPGYHTPQYPTPGYPSIQPVRPIQPISWGGTPTYPVTPSHPNPMIGCDMGYGSPSYGGPTVYTGPTY